MSSFGATEDALLVAVREQPTIESLLIEGNKDVKSEDLNRTLFDNGISEGSLVKPSVLEEVELSLTDLYFGRGKYGAEVNVDVTELPDNKVDVVIDITEGDRSRIRQINIVGNELFTDKELKKDFELKTPNWLSFIRQDDRYSREAFAGRPGKTALALPGSRLCRFRAAIDPGDARARSEGRIHHHQCP